MATIVTWNSSTYTVPATGEENWGGVTKVDGLLVSLATNGFQKTGGTFTLSADADFGATAGLKSIYYKSRASSLATTGVVRLGNTEVVAWRNAADSANLPLTADSSNRLTYNSNIVQASDGSMPGKTFTDALTHAHIATPSTPASGYAKTYVKSNNKLYLLNSSGAESLMTTAFFAVAAKTTTYTATIDDDVIKCDTSGGGWTLTLPAASTASGKKLTIIKTSTDTNALTIDGNSSETIDGTTTKALVTQYQKLEIVCDGSNWLSASRSDAPAALAAKTTTYTATIDDDVIKCDTSGAAWTLTLPAAATAYGKTLHIIKTTNDFNALTIDGNSSETIDGSTTITLNTQYERVSIVCDGSNWLCVHRSMPSKWTSFTPTGSWVTNATYTGRWRRVGSNIEVQTRLAIGGAPTAAALTIDLPSGLTIDTSSLVSATSRQYLGGGLLFDNSGGSGLGFIKCEINYSSTTAVAVIAVDDASGSSHYEDSVTDTFPFTFANNDVVNVVYSVPISGWST